MRSPVAIAVIGWLLMTMQVHAVMDVPAAPASDRYYVSRILQVKDLVLAKDVARTTFAFELAPGDELKITCMGCTELLDKEDRGYLQMELLNASGKQAVRVEDLNTWLPGPAAGGKVAVAILRDGLGERLLHLPGLTILRKSTTMLATVAGKSMGVLSVNGLALPRLQAGAAEKPTVFLIGMRGNDSYRVKVVDNGGGPAVIGYVHRAGEEFARKPLVTDAPAPLPASDDAAAQFGFEFEEPAGSKGFHSYHIEIDRIPAQSAGESSPEER